MSEDEADTVETLNAYKEIMFTLIKQHRGRVIDSPGDNLLAEFASVVDAVQCGVAVQKELQARNAERSENRRMEFRIGINLGDVIEEEDRIFGDGVNIAARLEALADAGGICISKTAFDTIETKLPLGYEYLGEKEVKNIAKPVGAYRVLMDEEAAGKVIGETRPKTKQLRWAAVGALAVLIIGAGALAIWNFYLRPDVEPASVEKMSYPLPDKPSIAVMAFANMSGDPEQEYFSDGLTEEIITTLSKVSDLFVIARQSTSSYKGKPVKVRQVAEELGVRYILEGSVRKSEDRLRVTARLIDALTGRQLWADRYDRELEDTFAVQDEITKEVVTALEVKLTMGDQARLFAKGTDNVEAWALGRKAWKIYSKLRKENNVKARELLDRAIKLDPNYPFLWMCIATTHFVDARMAWTKPQAESLKLAMEFTEKTLSLDQENPYAHSLLGNIYLFQRQYEKAIAEGQRAISLNPNFADGYAMLAQIMRYSGRFEEALELIKKAMRLSPIHRAFYTVTLATTYLFLERYEEAIPVSKQLIERSQRRECPPEWGHTSLIMAYMGLGREEEARAVAEKLLRIVPTYSLEKRAIHPYKDRAHLEQELSALRKAGLPDKPPLPLPDKPSIAVLPFVNMSGDPEQEYFSDGMTEQIIAALSKSPDLFVISRSSTFTYKEKSVKAQQVSRDLGVRYVVEGSVQKAGDQVRITAQLIDAKSGHNLWAESYDRRLSDIFALQDEITIKIMSSLRVKLLWAREGEPRSLAPGTINLQSYLKFMEAWHYFLRGSADDYSLARRLAEEAIALDPEYPSPYIILAWTHLMDALLGTSKSPRNSMGKAFRLAQKLVAMDESFAPAHAVLGIVYRHQGKYEKAIAELERAVALDPNYPQNYMYLGESLSAAGRPQEAIPLLKKSMRLSPLSQRQASTCLYRLGVAYRLMGQYEEALSALKKAADIRPDFWGIQLSLAATYINLGREEEARAAAGEVRRIVPKFSLERFAKRPMLKDQAEWERFIDALRKAGLT
jgi:adenylate cyclase